MVDFATPLDQVFKNATHVRVLRALHEVPTGFGISGREVARRAGVAHPSAAKALALLTEQGLVTVRRSPRLDEFHLNGEHVLGGPVRYVFDSERRLQEELRSSLRLDLQRLGVSRAYLFGSVAAGTSMARSDIDLAVERPAHATPAFDVGIESLREKTRSHYGNELNVIFRQSPETGRSAAIWRRLTKGGIPIFDQAA